MVDRLINHGLADGPRRSIRATFPLQGAQAQSPSPRKELRDTTGSAGIRLILAILHGPMADNNHIYRQSLGLAVSAVWLGYAAIAFFIAAVAGLADRDTTIAIEKRGAV
jgi:hypothetical protein